MEARDRPASGPTLVWSTHYMSFYGNRARQSVAPHSYMGPYSEGTPSLRVYYYAGQSHRYDPAVGPTYERFYRARVWYDMGTPGAALPCDIGIINMNVNTILSGAYYNNAVLIRVYSRASGVRPTTWGGFVDGVYQGSFWATPNTIEWVQIDCLNPLDLTSCLCFVASNDINNVPPGHPPSGWPYYAEVASLLGADNSPNNVWLERGVWV